MVATAEKVLKAAFGDKFRPSPPLTASEDFSEFINAGVPSMFFNIGVYDPERVAARAQGRRPAAAGQPFAAVRAGAEADHPDRRHGDDARSAERIRPEGQTAVTAPPAVAGEAKAKVQTVT